MGQSLYHPCGYLPSSVYCHFELEISGFSLELYVYGFARGRSFSATLPCHIFSGKINKKLGCCFYAYQYGSSNKLRFISAATRPFIRGPYSKHCRDPDWPAHLLPSTGLTASHTKEPDNTNLRCPVLRCLEKVMILFFYCGKFCLEMPENRRFPNNFVASLNLMCSRFNCN